MPQLFSRVDDLNWLTPTIADILDQGATPPGGDGSIRQQLLELQQRLTELNTPARVVNVRPTPSYTFFVLKPETVGRLGNRRTVSLNEIRRSLGTVAEEKREWKLGLLPQAGDAEESFGILLRTEEHQPLSLRRMLVRSSFRDHASKLAIPIGNSIEQSLVIADLNKVGNIALIGTETVKQYSLISWLMTLTMLNTPGELRLAFAGEGAKSLIAFTQVPHLLGRPLIAPADGARLLNGLSQEMRRRLTAFEESGSHDLDHHNGHLHEQGQTIVPRILLVIDSLSDEPWLQMQAGIIPHLEALLESNGRAGIHLIITANQPDAPHIPEAIAPHLKYRFILNPSAGDYINDLQNFHPSLTRFTDGFVVDETEDTVNPVEISTVSSEETKRLIAYWRQMSSQRKTEDYRISGRTGVTQQLDPTTLKRATQEAPTVANASPEAPTPPDQQEAQAGHLESRGNIEAKTIRQAKALCAYLGWIGSGPLQDILELSPEEAHRVIAFLRDEGVIEDNDSPTPRFLKIVNQ